MALPAHAGDPVLSCVLEDLQNGLVYPEVDLSLLPVELVLTGLAEVESLPPAVLSCCNARRGYVVGAFLGRPDNPRKKIH